MYLSQTSVEQPYVIDSNATLHSGDGSTEEVYISRVDRVHVTSSNVDQLYQSICEDETQIPCGQIKSEPADIDIVNKVLDLANSLTQDMFIDQIISDTRADILSLEDMRVTLYEAVKAADGYPFNTNLELIKRKQTRKGDLSRKLARDIHSLTLVLDGAAFEDLKDVISFTSVKSGVNSSLYATASVELSETEILRNTVEKMAADMLSMKQASTEMRKELMKEIAKLKSEFTKMKSDFEGEVSELRELIQVNAQSIERVCSDKSNGNACLKNDIRVIRNDIKVLADDLSTKVDSKVLSVETDKLTSLVKRIGKFEKAKANSPVTLDDKGIHSIEHPERKDNHLSSQCDKEVRSANQDMTVNPVNTSSHSYAEVALISGNAGLGDTRRGMPPSRSLGVSSDNIGVKHKTFPKPATSHEIQNGRQISDMSTSNGSGRDSLGDVRRLGGSGQHSPPTGANRDHSLRDSYTSTSKTQSSFVNPMQNQLAGGPKIPPNTSPTVNIDQTSRAISDKSSVKERAIPVRITQAEDRRQNAGVISDVADDEEEDFTIYVRRKVKRFYIGGFKSNMTEEKFVKYVKRRGVTVTWVKFFPVRNSNRLTIQLNLEDDEYCESVLEEWFWPKNIICRPWVSWNSYRKYGRSYDREHRNYDNDGNDY